MITITFLLAAATAATAAHPDPCRTDIYRAWSATHSSNPGGTCQAVLDNHARVIRHNRLHLGHTLELNQFADLTPERFRATHNGFARARPGARYPPAWPNHTASCPTKEQWAAIDLPETFDWRDANVVTAVKNQEQCGSCWAFSTTETVESALSICSGKPPPVLSPQELVDCTNGQGMCSGCQGGLFDCAFNYTNTVGLETNQQYPYTATNQPCASNATLKHRRVVNWTRIDTGDEACLRWHVRQGPVSIAMDAGAWQMYKYGVVNDTTCSKQYLDHAIQLVGWGKTDAGVPYWIVRNSWGVAWGEQGYIRVIRGTGTCGIDTMATRAVAC